MLTLIFKQLKHRLPTASILLVLSCLFSTIPQFFLSGSYSTFTGLFPPHTPWFWITLPSFTHSPGFLPVHMTGNLLVILFFGGLMEILIGTARFSLMTLATFTTTTLVSLLHYAGSGSIHGASGICFGYHMFFLFFFIILMEEDRKRLLRSGTMLVLSGLFLFDLFGIPLVEVKAMGQRFFENFGQTIHLVSYCTILPFLLVWRRDIEEAVHALLRGEQADTRHTGGPVPFLMLALLLALNLGATISAAAGVM